MKASARKKTVSGDQRPADDVGGVVATRAATGRSRPATTTPRPGRCRGGAGCVRRTKRTSSMTRIAANAAIEEAWPEGKLKFSCRPRVSCQSGRSRPSQRLEAGGGQRGRDHDHGGEQRGPALTAYDEGEDQQRRSGSSSRWSPKATSTTRSASTSRRESSAQSSRRRPSTSKPSSGCPVAGDEDGQDGEEAPLRRAQARLRLREAGVTCEVCPNRFESLMSGRLASAV